MRLPLAEACCRPRPSKHRTGREPAAASQRPPPATAGWHQHGRRLRRYAPMPGAHPDQALAYASAGWLALVRLAFSATTEACLTQHDDLIGRSARTAGQRVTEELPRATLVPGGCRPGQARGPGTPRWGPRSATDMAGPSTNGPAIRPTAEPLSGASQASAGEPGPRPARLPRDDRGLLGTSMISRRNSGHEGCWKSYRRVFGPGSSLSMLAVHTHCPCRVGSHMRQSAL